MSEKKKTSKAIHIAHSYKCVECGNKFTLQGASIEGAEITYYCPVCSIELIEFEKAPNSPIQPEKVVVAIVQITHHDTPQITKLLSKIIHDTSASGGQEFFEWVKRLQDEGWTTSNLIITIPED